MATNGWGQGVENNTIEWGKGKDNATNDWGKVYETSASGDTLLEVATVPFSNTKSVDFDGVDDFVDMGDVLDFERTDAFSISLWFKRTRSGVSEFLVAKQESSGDLKGYTIILPTDNKVTFVFRNNPASSGRLIVDGTTAITDTNWHHTVVTYDGSSATSGVKIYLDGSDDTGAVQGTLSATTVNSIPFQIGARNGGVEFSGKIDETAVFNTELSSSDVTAIYNSGIPASLSSYSSLVSWWRMGDNDTFPTLTDNGSGGNNGTMTNMVAGDIQTDVPT